MSLVVTTDITGASVAINPLLVQGLTVATTTPPGVFVRTATENFVLPGTVASVAALLAGGSSPFATQDYVNAQIAAFGATLAQSWSIIPRLFWAGSATLTTTASSSAGGNVSALPGPGFGIPAGVVTALLVVPVPAGTFAAGHPITPATDTTFTVVHNTVATPFVFTIPGGTTAKRVFPVALAIADGDTIDVVGSNTGGGAGNYAFDLALVRSPFTS